MSTTMIELVEFMPICDDHREGWWDGADWDGNHLERPIRKEA